MAIDIKDNKRFYCHNCTLRSRQIFLESCFATNCDKSDLASLSCLNFSFRVKYFVGFVLISVGREGGGQKSQPPSSISFGLKTNQKTFLS